MGWYLKALKQYADFSNRACRKEYWMFFLFDILATLVLGLMSNILPIFGVVGAIYVLALIVPRLAVSVRRLHDVGHSGWCLLLPVVVPVILFLPTLVYSGKIMELHFIIFVSVLSGFVAVWLFVQTIHKGQPGENKWGLNPKESLDYSPYKTGVYQYSKIQKQA